MVLWAGVRYLFFAMLGLLVCLSCLIAAHAAELPVIKYAEAARYAGEHVAVRGLVASVTASPLGTAYINFGGEYPNQTFAGFVSAESKLANDQRLTTLQGKIIDIIGTIVLYEGKPEIKVLSADQIRILAPRPVQQLDCQFKRHCGNDDPDEPDGMMPEPHGDQNGHEQPQQANECQSENYAKGDGQNRYHIFASSKAPFGITLSVEKS
jgi:hypothetical protein